MGAKLSHLQINQASKLMFLRNFANGIFKLVKNVSGEGKNFQDIF
jgi:hypothetical protein